MMGSFLIRADSNVNGAAKDRPSVSNMALPQMGLGGLRIDADGRGATGPLAKRVTRQEGSITRFCGAFLKAKRGRFFAPDGAARVIAACRLSIFDSWRGPLPFVHCPLRAVPSGADNIFRVYGMRRSPFPRAATTLYLMSLPLRPPELN
jgi:hypothetical protein